MHIEVEYQDGTVQKRKYAIKSLDGLKIDGKVKVVFESQEDFDSLIDELSDKSNNPAFRNFLMTSKHAMTPSPSMEDRIVDKVLEKLSPEIRSKISSVNQGLPV